MTSPSASGAVPVLTPNDVAPSDIAPHNISLHDAAPPRDGFRDEVLRGLGQPQKTLPCKFFYDRRGSELFERICELDEYYPTRTEMAIMARYAPEMAVLLGRDCLLVELGSGSSLKTRALLDHLESPAGYVPVDISREHLLQSARALAADYPGLSVLPVCADYTQRFRLPAPDKNISRRAVYFPGSTVGNFEPHAARGFLRRVAALCGAGGALLVGVDLKKDTATLEAAYNDGRGVTAAFNLNLLQRINRELDGDFAIEHFSHRAIYNEQAGRIEMHLASRREQTARVAGATFAFRESEMILTEYSYKYGLNDFARLASEAGWRVARVWTDERRLFSVQYLTVAGG